MTGEDAMAKPTIRVNLTQSERCRLYCAMVDCPYCESRRGENCFDPRQPDGRKRWYKSWHGQRGRLVQAERKSNPDFRARYGRLIAQIVMQRGVGVEELGEEYY